MVFKMIGKNALDVVGSVRGGGGGGGDDQEDQELFKDQLEPPFVACMCVHVYVPG